MNSLILNRFGREVCRELRQAERECREWWLNYCALAEYRVSRDIDKALSRLEPITDHLFDAGLGSISEIFDADPPHRPRGAPAQVWSVACILEAWWRLETEKAKIAGYTP